MQDADIDKLVLEYCKKRGWGAGNICAQMAHGIEHPDDNADTVLCYGAALQKLEPYCEKKQVLTAWLCQHRDFMSTAMAS